jgi:hypothetical protein
MSEFVYYGEYAYISESISQDESMYLKDTTNGRGVILWKIFTGLYVRPKQGPTVYCRV